MGYILGFFLLLSSFLLTLYANSELINNARLVARTHKVVSNLEAMISKVKDGEIGFRGYLITADEEYLGPYFGSRKSVDSIYHATRLLVERDQQDSLDQLKAGIETKYFYFESALSMVRYNNQVFSANMLDSFKKSGASMDQVMKEVRDMQQNEDIQIQLRDAKLRKITDTVQSFVLASMVIAFFLVIFGFSFHVKENKERMSAEKKVRAYQDELKTRIQELGAANRELIEMRREEKFAATGRIARTIAHEIRNPLTNINLAADQLNAELESDVEGTAYLFEMITRNSNRINQLLSELLTSTKFAELKFVKVSINDLLDETLQEAKDRILLNHVALVKRYAMPPCTISVDREKMKIALLNIIINSLEALETRPKGRLIITTQRMDSRCIISIEDNGPGMNEETQTKLFEPYFTTKLKGNGLGLTNSQNIILNHKGTINVQSRAGEGTLFTILLRTE